MGEFQKRAISEWRKTPIEICRTLIESIPRRLEKVLVNEGEVRGETKEIQGGGTPYKSVFTEHYVCRLINGKIFLRGETKEKIPYIFRGAQCPPKQP
jgi:hypothetical protein